MEPQNMFEFGDLSYHKMSDMVRDLDVAHRVNGVTIVLLTKRVEAQGKTIIDLLTRVSDLEQAMGEHYQAHSVDYSPEDDKEYQVLGFDATGKPALFDSRTFFSGESQEGGNSGFEQAEERRLEREPWDRPESYFDGIADNAHLEQSGTHSPDCRCAWCEPQERIMGTWN